jgi:hypothetical protein
LIDYETDINVLILSFIFYIPLHVSICRDHHLLVSEYISVVMEFSAKMGPFLHLVSINKKNNIHERDMLHMKG